MPVTVKRVPLFREDIVIFPSVPQFQADQELVPGKNNINWTSSEFQDVIAGVLEKRVLKGQAVSQKLNRDAKTREIVKVIGQKRALHLADLATLLNSQKESFIAVVLIKGQLWAVRAFWNAGYD